MDTIVLVDIKSFRLNEFVIIQVLRELGGVPRLFDAKVKAKALLTEAGIDKYGVEIFEACKQLGIAYIKSIADLHKAIDLARKT